MKVTEITAYTACGLQMVGNFGRGDRYDPDLRSLGEGNTGYRCSGMINTLACRKAYEIIASKYKIVYQSDVRINENSDNQFFIIVFDTRSTSNAS